MDQIFSSPLGRCLETAVIVGKDLSVPVTVVADLAEVDHGTFTGLTHQEIEERHPGELARREADKYRWAFPDGESYAHADRRAARALTDSRLTIARRPLLISHEMIGRMLQRQLLHLDTAQALASSHPQNLLYLLRPGPRTREVITIPRP